MDEQTGYASESVAEAAMSTPTDEPTRFLAAAVHLDDALADALVEEYLAEPKRAVPPSPGVDAVTVLREAAAAQWRRRTINLVLVATLVLTTVFSPILVLVWLIAGLTWRLCAAIVARLAQGRGGSNWFLADRHRQWWVTALMWSALTVLSAALPSLAMESMGEPILTTPDSALSTVFMLITLALVTAMLCLLIARHYLPWQVATTWYSYGRYQPDSPPREAAVTASAPYADRLHRITQDQLRRAQDSSGEVVVYRGHKPFVGAGARVRSWSSALELYASSVTTESAEEPRAAAPVPSFEPRELQEFVTADLTSLRRAPTLTPGWRFADLGVTSWALLSPADLLHNPSGRALLGRLDAGSEPELNAEDWAALSNESPEWLRYYRCFRLEGWARQLAVSGFLHVGCEERMLVLEWHGFVLAPIAPEFRRVDAPPSMLELRTLWAAAGDLALLPTSVPGRVADVIRGLWARRRTGGTWTTPDQAEQVFGAAASIRELGAGGELANLFQETDCDRYLKILEQRTLDSVHRFLMEKGIAAKGFSDMVKQINNSTVINNSNIIAGNIGGMSNSGSVGAGGSTSTN
ncbi:MerC domain-containing protein [Nocardia cyriacigeorgica]|uniref:MerC domain-containing protein n=1 Tax=Nocardia cyriacigeorgica TaxID=135487 RepID=A0A5R8NXB7_9NOCA|nr:MerC domain-containing protein [Nocardia cyriacigeorgica]TLF80806.1 MerC domain-containing protein [Nocardia cyriacigeorgica]